MTAFLCYLGVWRDVQCFTVAFDLLKFSVIFSQYVMKLSSHLNFRKLEHY